MRWLATEVAEVVVDMVEVVEGEEAAVVDTAAQTAHR